MLIVECNVCVSVRCVRVVFIKRQIFVHYIETVSSLLIACFFFSLVYWAKWLHFINRKNSVSVVFLLLLSLLFVFYMYSSLCSQFQWCLIYKFIKKNCVQHFRIENRVVWYWGYNKQRLLKCKLVSIVLLNVRVFYFRDSERRNTHTHADIYSNNNNNKNFRK